MSDYESIYKVITPSGVFEAVWGEEPLLIEYRGSEAAILHFKNFMAMNHISGAHGILLNAGNLEPDDLYNFCQPNDSGIIVIPPFDDLLAFEQEELQLNQEAAPVLDNITDKTMLSGIEKLKLAKELSGIRGNIASAGKGFEKLKMAKRVREIRAVLGVKLAVATALTMKMLTSAIDKLIDQFMAELAWMENKAGESKWIADFADKMIEFDGDKKNRSKYVALAKEVITPNSAKNFPMLYSHVIAGTTELADIVASLSDGALPVETAEPAPVLPIPELPQGLKDNDDSDLTRTDMYDREDFLAVNENKLIDYIMTNRMDSDNESFDEFMSKFDYGFYPNNIAYFEDYPLLKFCESSLILEQEVEVYGGSVVWGDFDASAFNGEVFDSINGDDFFIYDAVGSPGSIVGQIADKKGFIVARVRIEENGVLTLLTGNNGTNEVAEPSAVLSKIHAAVAVAFGGEQNKSLYSGESFVRIPVSSVSSKIPEIDDWVVTGITVVNGVVNVVSDYDLPKDLYEKVRLMILGSNGPNLGLEAGPRVDTNIGRKWHNRFKDEVEIVSIKNGEYYTLLNGKIGGSPIIPKDDLEDVVTADEDWYQHTLKMEAQTLADDNAEAERLAAHESEYATITGKDALDRSRKIKALSKQHRYSDGRVLTIKKYVEEEVAKGAVVETNSYYNERSGNSQLERVMITVDEFIKFTKDIGKTGLDYAEELIAKRDASEEASGATDKPDTPATLSQAQAAIKYLKGFIGTRQLNAISTEMRGEEKQFFFDKLVALEKHIKKMPKTYDQDGLGDKAIAYIHYFRGNMDWHITERDMDTDNEGQIQAFGMANLGHGGELGYISIVELIKNNVEIDLYWTPQTIRKIQGKDDAVAVDKGVIVDETPHYPTTILNELVIQYGWTHSTPMGSINKDVGGNALGGETNPSGSRIVSAAFPGDVKRYLTLHYGWDDIFDIDCRDREINGVCKEFNDRVNKWANESSSTGTIETPEIVEEVAVPEVTNPEPVIIEPVAPTPSGNPEIANQKLKLQNLTSLQEQMKSANKVLKNSKLSGEQKKEQLLALGYGDQDANKLMQPDFAGRMGFTYHLTNNNAVIKNTQKRIAQLEAQDLTAAMVDSGDRETSYDFDGGTIDLDYDDDRLRVNFDTKPGADMIAKMKQNGFKWSPTNSAWQRQLTDNAISRANYMFGTSIQTASSAMRDAENAPRPNPVIVPEGLGQAAFETELNGLMLETDIETYLSKLEEIAVRVESAGLSAELDAQLNKASDKLTELMSAVYQAA